MTIFITQSGGASVMMRLAQPKPPRRPADPQSARILLLDLLDSVLDAH